MTPPALHLTVAVCTWNRCALLAKTLEQMTRLVIPPEVTWELLVVNNRSTDSTDEVITSYEGRLPIRRCWEPTPGLSNARNRALSEATGEYILWTDDDIFVDEGWVVGYARAFRRWPKAAVFGGPIEPLFEGPPPDWIPRVMDHIGPVYGRQTLGDTPVPLAPARVGAGPYGGNMAMRRDALLRFPFDPDLGVRHGEYAIGEETEVIRRMLEAGHAGWWTPEAGVRHWVPRSSQTLGYVRRWMVGCGRYIAQDHARRVSRPRLYARMLRHEIRYRVRRPFLAPERWIKDLARASHARGQLLASHAREGRS
jgi:glycosyltransferase involved in cell wall biosynthesis